MPLSGLDSPMIASERLSYRSPNCGYVDNPRAGNHCGRAGERRAVGSFGATSGHLGAGPVPHIPAMARIVPWTEA